MWSVRHPWQPWDRSVKGWIGLPQFGARAHGFDGGREVIRSTVDVEAQADTRVGRLRLNGPANLRTHLLRPHLQQVSPPVEREHQAGWPRFDPGLPDRPAVTPESEGPARTALEGDLAGDRLDQSGRPTVAVASRTSRSVIPAEFIRLAASRKNGTASRMKLL